MDQRPKWFLPAAIAALMWNALGCAAYLQDVMLTPDAIAKMSAAQQAMYHSRPAWSVGATAVAVWFGALGSLGLILRKRWATGLLIASLLGVVAQDTWLFGMSGAAGGASASAIVLQGLVLVIAIGLVVVARKAASKGWIA
jgi:hypothetical protein